MRMPQDDLLPDSVDVQTAKDIRYEHSVVHRIVQRLPQRAATDIRRRQQESDERYTFAMLREHVEFGAWLVARKLRGLDDLFEKLRKSPTKTSVYNAYCDEVCELPEDVVRMHTLGVVFEWSHYCPYAVFHDAYRMVWAGDNVPAVSLQIRGNRFTLQSLDTFLTGMGYGEGTEV